MDGFNKYFLLYFLTAQTLCDSKVLKRSFLKYIPLLVHLVVTIICADPTIDDRCRSDKSLTDWFLDIFKLNFIMPSILMIVSNISTKSEFQNIPHIMFDLITDIEQYFGVNFRAEKFKRSHNYNIFIRTSFHLFTLIYREFIPVFACSKMTGRIIASMNIFNIAFELYFLFHIDMMHSLLQFFNANLRYLKSAKLDECQRFHILSYISYVHCEIWLIKSHIERRFGWTLLAVLLDKFIQFTIHPFDMFRLGANNGSVLQITRKYVFLFFYFSTF